jgi:hypothetical protein
MVKEERRGINDDNDFIELIDYDNNVCFKYYRNG